MAVGFASYCGHCYCYYLTAVKDFADCSVAVAAAEGKHFEDYSVSCSSGKEGKDY